MPSLPGCGLDRAPARNASLFVSPNAKSGTFLRHSTRPAAARGRRSRRRGRGARRPLPSRAPVTGGAGTASRRRSVGQETAHVCWKMSLGRERLTARRWGEVPLRGCHLVPCENSPVLLQSADLFGASSLLLAAHPWRTASVARPRLTTIARNPVEPRATRTTTRTSSRRRRRSRANARRPSGPRPRRKRRRPRPRPRPR